MQQHIVILTGAGVSAESGLATFRDNNGLWENHRVEDVATPEAFVRNPDLVYRFYNARRAQLQLDHIMPNTAHHALADLEKEFDGHVTLITQNVDDLHERAGSQRVLHMHGELLSARCVNSGQRQQWTELLTEQDICQCCRPGSSLRPDIVWFGEVPMYMDAIYQAVSKASLFVSIGTSGQVYPAAGLVDFASDCGASTLFINAEGTDNSEFQAQLIGPATQTVPQWVTSVLESQ